MTVLLLFLLFSYSYASPDNCTLVSIKNGDTCYKLWTDNGMTQENFNAANPSVNCQNLQIGQNVCIIPDPLLPGQYRDDPNSSTCRKLYSIKSGDTCQALWLSNSLNESTFLSSNPGINCQNLQIGQKVCLNGYLPDTSSHQYDPYQTTTPNGINSNKNPTSQPSNSTPRPYYNPYPSMPSSGGNVMSSNNHTSYIPTAQYQQTQNSPVTSQAFTSSEPQASPAQTVQYQQAQTSTQGQQPMYQPQQQSQSSPQSQQTFYQPQQAQYQPQSSQSYYQPQAQQTQYKPQAQQSFYQPQAQQSQYQPQAQQSQYQPQTQQSQFQPQTQQTFYQPLAQSYQYQPQAQQSQNLPQAQQSQNQPQTQQQQNQPQTQQFSNAAQYQPQTQQATYQTQTQQTQYQPQQSQYNSQSQQPQSQYQQVHYEPQTQQNVPFTKQYQPTPAQYQYSASNVQAQTPQPSSSFLYGAPVAQYPSSYQTSGVGQNAQTQVFRPLYDSSSDTTVNETCRIHTIKLGDTCFDIWSANGMTQSEFTQLNPSVNCQTLQLGQQVCTDPNTLRPGQFRDDASCQKLYSIKAGDTCANLWQTNGISEQQFMQRNTGINCNNLQIGQDICLS